MTLTPTLTPTLPLPLPLTLQCFLDERGVYNARRDVRTKACYLLLRLVKLTLRASDAHTLDAIISRLLALLLLQQQVGPISNPKPPLTPTPTLNPNPNPQPQP